MTADVLAVAVGIGIGAILTVAFERIRRRPTPHVERNAPSPRPHNDDRTQLVLSALPFAAFLVDRGGFVRFINAAAEQLFRIDARKSLGQGMIAVVPSVVLERQVLAAIAGDGSTRDVVIADRARELTLGVTACPYEGGAVVVAADRSDLVALEHVRREFVANVSHELRTPLSAMKLMMETVLVSDDDVEARTLFLPQIAHEVERMIRLVEDLLELARSESGNLPLRRELFDLTEVAAAVFNTFAGRSAALGVELDLEAPEAVYVDADRHRLTQVALNLVDNALRHTPSGGTVTIEVGRERASALLSVRDTGSGIPYGDLPHIFERFYVVDRSRSREHGGTGLGLSIARHLVELHGGTIRAESIYGQGAAFTCAFPAVSVASPVPPRAVP